MDIDEINVYEEAESEMEMGEVVSNLESLSETNTFDDDEL